MSGESGDLGGRRLAKNRRRVFVDTTRPSFGSHPLGRPPGTPGGTMQSRRPESTEMVRGCQRSSSAPGGLAREVSTVSYGVIPISSLCLVRQPGYEPPAEQTEHAVTGLGQRDVVGDDHGGQPIFSVHLAEERVQIARRGFVEVAGWLVG